MSYIRVCDTADGCQDEGYTLCEELDRETSSAGESRMAAQRRGHGMVSQYFTICKALSQPLYPLPCLCLSVHWTHTSTHVWNGH